MEENRMTLGAYLKAYFKQCLEVLKHPKMLLPTAIMVVVWVGLGILQNKVSENLPLSILNFLTFAQGGLYGGIFGAIGGILGKIVVAAFVNVMIVPLFYKQNPFANFSQGFKEVVANVKVKGTEAIATLLKGAGAALLLYSIFNVTQSFENSMVGIVSAVGVVAAVARKGGFLWGLVLSFLNSVSKKKVPTYQQIVHLLTGMTMGFSLGVVLCVLGITWAFFIGLAVLIAGLVMGGVTKKEAVASVILVLFLLAPAAEAKAGGKWVLVSTDTHVSSTTTHHEDVTPYHSWIVDVTNIQATRYGFSFDAVENHTRKSNDEKTKRTMHYVSTFDPFEKSYKPGDKFYGNHRWKDYAGFVKVNVKGYIDTNTGKEDYNTLGPAAQQDGFAYAHFTFPPKNKVNGDKLIVKYVAKIYDETVTLTYVFQWNGRADSSLTSDEDDEDQAFLDWLKDVFDIDGPHASDLTTIIIGILGALGGLGGGLGGVLGGGIGGAGGGGFGGGIPGGDFPTGDIPGGEGPMGGNDPSPEELEWERYQKEKDERFKKYVHDNPDGTKTYTDPATGQQHTLYPKYNSETGEFTHWENENDSPYDEEKLNDWLAWRERNNETFAQDAAQAQRNLNEQRAMNQAQNDYDRERGSSAMADKWKADKEQMEKDFEHEMRLRDYAWKKGLTDTDKETLTKSLLKDRHEALEDGAQAMNDAAYWNDAVNYAETTERIADTTINVMGEFPGNRGVKNFYNVLKSVAKHGMTGAVKGQGWGEVAKEVGVGAVEGGLSVLQNQEMTGVFGTSLLGKITKAGINVGAESLKSIINDVMDPNKSASEILDNATNAGLNRVLFEGVGEMAKGLGGLASDATEAGATELGSFSQEMGFHNPVADTLGHELNILRRKLFGA